MKCDGCGEELRGRDPGKLEGGKVLCLYCRAESKRKRWEAPPGPVVATEDPETCARCGRVIEPGKTPMIWGEEVVCERCHGGLLKREGLAPNAEKEPAMGRSGAAILVPEFGGMRVAQAILIAFGVVGMLIGALGVIAGVAAGNQSTAATGGAGLVSGLLLFAAGEVIHGLRHVAINSFHIRNAVSK